jgi:hypothetical protein
MLINAVSEAKIRELSDYISHLEIDKENMTENQTLRENRMNFIKSYINKVNQI